MSLLGVEVRADGVHDPHEVAALGAKWVRFVERVEIDGTPVDQRGYIHACQAAGLGVMLVFDRTSMRWVEEDAWHDVAAEAASRYDGLADLAVIGNEPSNDPEPGKSPSSWIQSVDEVNRLIEAFAATWHQTPLCGPGMGGGPADWLPGGFATKLHHDKIRYRSVHSYGQGTPDFRGPYESGVEGHHGLLDLVAPFGPYIVGEFGVNGADMPEDRAAEFLGHVARYLRQRRDCWIASCYSYQDGGAYGLLRPDGSPRPSFFMFRDAASIEVPDQPDIPVIIPPEPPREEEPTMPDGRVFPHGGLKDLWTIMERELGIEIPFDVREESGLGICREWVKAPYKYGAPLGPERDHPGGGVIQMFVQKAIYWGEDGPRDVE